MAETHTSNRHHTLFKDILNHRLEKPRPETEHSAQKQQKLKTSRSEGPPEKEKKIESVSSEINETDKTVKKETNLHQEEVASVQTINEHQPQIVKEELDNPEWDQYQEPSVGEISRVIRLQTDFESITDLFLELARKSKLLKCQHTDSFLTVKKGGLGSCKCIYKFWESSEPDATVYQLRRYPHNSRKAKLILVDGEQKSFQLFFLNLLRQLQSKKLAKVLPWQKVLIIFDEQIKETNDCAKLINHLGKKIDKGKKVKSEDVETVVGRLKNQSTRLKFILRKTPGLVDLTALERQIQDLCYRTSGVLTLFDKLYCRQFDQYRCKRENLLRKYPICDLFKQLQISTHFSQFKRLRSMQEIDPQETVPYMSAIKELRRLAGLQSAGVSFDSVITFHQKIRSCYSQYFKNCLKLGDMDDYLPVTIFCVLAVDCDQNLLASVKWLLAQISREEDCEWQKKTLTDLQAAFEYILHQWHPEK